MLPKINSDHYSSGQTTIKQVSN